MDYYAVLKITNRNCTLEDIKKAFYKLAHIHHPDKGGDTKEFQKINEAYQWLQKNHYPLNNQQFNQQRSRTIVYNNNGTIITYTTYF